MDDLVKCEGCKTWQHKRWRKCPKCGEYLTEEGREWKAKKDRRSENGRAYFETMMERRNAINEKRAKNREKRKERVIE